MSVTAQEFREVAKRKHWLAQGFDGIPGDAEAQKDAVRYDAAAEQAEQLERGIDREMALAARIERAEAHVTTLTARVAELEARITEAHELDYRRVQHIRELSTLITAWEAKAAK